MAFKADRATHLDRSRWIFHSLVRAETLRPMSRTTRARSAGWTVARALLLALPFASSVLAKPVPKGTLTAADAMMKGAAKQADAGHADKAIDQAKKAVDLVAHAGGPDAPELVKLRADEAHVANAAGDTALASEAVRDGVRIALAGPAHADGATELENELAAMTAHPTPTPEMRALLEDDVHLLDHEGAAVPLAEAYGRLAAAIPPTDSDALRQAEEKRIATLAGSAGANAKETLHARLDATERLASSARTLAPTDRANAMKLETGAESLFAPIDPGTLDASEKASFANLAQSLATTFVTTRDGLPELSTSDADHALSLLDRATLALDSGSPETIGTRAHILLDEGLFEAASGRVAEARDRDRSALDALVNAPKDTSPTIPAGAFDGLLAFLDTSNAAAGAASAGCKPVGARTSAAHPLAPYAVVPVCAPMDAVRALAESGAAAAKRAKDAASEARFHVRVASAACADGDGDSARRELDAVLEATRTAGDSGAVMRREYEDAALLASCDVNAAETRITDAIGLSKDPADDTDIRAFGAFADGVWKRTGEAHRVERLANLLLDHADKIDPSGKKRGRAALVAGEKLAMADRANARALLDAAIDALTKDAPAGPPDAPRAALLVRAYAASARAARLAGDGAKAATELEKALDASDASGASPSDVLKLLVELARIDRDRRDPTGLAKVSTRALALPPLAGDDAVRLAEIGRILSIGDPASARAFYEARKDKTNDTSELVDVARIYALQGDHAGARTMLENAYSQDQRNPEIDCALMGELAATGEPDASAMLRDKLVREIDPSNHAAPRALGCLIDGLSHSGHIADADDVVRRLFDAETKDATAAGQEPVLVPLEAAWAYRVAGDGERAAKWGAIYQRAIDRIALAHAVPDVDRDVGRAFAEDHALPSLLDIEVAARPKSKAAIEAALETAVRWQSRVIGDADGADATVAAVREKLPKDGAFVAIVEVAPISIDPARTTAEAFDAIGPAADLKRDPPRYVAYVLPKKGDVRTFDIGNVTDVDAQVKAYLEGVARPGSDAARLASPLAHEIVAPILDAVSSARSFVIAADGELGVLPIGALPASGGAPLLYQHEVAYVPSGRFLLVKSGDAPSPAPTLIFATPDLAADKAKKAPGVAEAARVATGVHRRDRRRRQRRDRGRAEKGTRSRDLVSRYAWLRAHAAHAERKPGDLRGVPSVVDSWGALSRSARRCRPRGRWSRWEGR